MTTVTERRLRDGAKATTHSVGNLKSMSDRALQAFKDSLFDGSVALQSLDDLGSVEANQAAWADMRRLQARMIAVDAELKFRQNK